MKPTLLKKRKKPESFQSQRCKTVRGGCLQPSMSDEDVEALCNYFCMKIKLETPHYEDVD